MKRKGSISRRAIFGMEKKSCKNLEFFPLITLKKPSLLLDGFFNVVLDTFYCTIILLVVVPVSEARVKK